MSNNPVSTPVSNARLVPALRADVDQLKKLVAVLAASSDDLRGSELPAIKAAIAELERANPTDAGLLQQLDELREQIATFEWLKNRVEELSRKAQASDTFARDLVTAQKAAQSAMEQIQSFSDRLLSVEVKVEAHDSAITALKRWRHDTDARVNAHASAIARLQSGGDVVSWAAFTALAIGSFLASFWIITMAWDDWSKPNQLGLAGLITTGVMLVAMALSGMDDDRSSSVEATASAGAGVVTPSRPPVLASNPDSGATPVGQAPTAVQPVTTVSAAAGAGAVAQTTP